MRGSAPNIIFMENNLLSVWTTIGSVALAILILLVMITVHEFGHYIAGKIFHFKINEFSIGFGPALFKHRNPKTGELFAIRLVPLGGYCAFEGEDGVEEEEQPQEPSETRVFEEEAFEAGEEVPNGQTDPTVGAEKISPRGPDPNSFTKKPPWQRIIVLVAGAFMNYLLAVFLIIVCFFAYGQTMIAVYEAEPAEGEYIGYSFSDQDVLLCAEGKELYLTMDIVKAVNGKKEGDLVSFRVSRIVEKTADGTVREEMDILVMLRADVNVKNSSDISGVWAALGVKYYDGETEEASGYLLANKLYRFGFWETLGRSFVYSFKIAGSIFTVLGELLTGKLGLTAFGGPITTITMTSQMVSRGFRYFLEIAGYIGVNLAVFNLLPIPALDGCKIIFTAIEWVRGKPIGRKVEAAINLVGFIFLLGFAVLVDILQFI